jgi:hypothetical protein
MEQIVLAGTKGSRHNRSWTRVPFWMAEDTNILHLGTNAAGIHVHTNAAGSHALSGTAVIF